MEAFVKHKGIVATLDRSNVDTDQIIPKQFLKSIKRTGFGDALFFDWRYTADGKPDPEFEVNDPAYQGASILVTRNNFGCGSSREHAVWAVMQYGLKVVIAPARETEGGCVPAFADIFRNNSVNNGLLTIELCEKDVDDLISSIHAAKGVEATVDLEAQTITLHASDEKSWSFDIDAGVKKRLLEGKDEIALTLEHESDIAAFEQQHDVQLSA